MCSDAKVGEAERGLEDEGLVGTECLDGFNFYCRRGSGPGNLGRVSDWKEKFMNQKHNNKIKECVCWLYELNWISHRINGFHQSVSYATSLDSHPRSLINH